MLIICPNCSSSYLVRAEEIAADGKLVRCGVCKTSWRPEIERDLALGADSATPRDDSAPVQRKPAYFGWKSKNSRRILPLAGLGALAAAWFGTLIVPGSSAMEGALSRAKDWLATILPDHPANGLRLANIRTRVTTENGETALIIEGEIRSERSGEHPIPQLQFTMTDAEASTIFQWMIPPPAPVIAAGSPLTFSARLASPPRDAKDIRIRFAGA